MLPDSVGDFDDRRLAFLSLLEGDATLVMERFLHAAARRQRLGGASDLSQLAWPRRRVPGVPPVMRDQLVLPYVVGPGLRARAAGAGRLGALQAAWTAPPASMEQVLHPEKFFAREAPRAVERPLRAARAASLVARACWASLHAHVPGRGLRGDAGRRAVAAPPTVDDVSARRGWGDAIGLGRRRQDGARVAHGVGPRGGRARVQQAALRRLERTPRRAHSAWRARPCSRARAGTCAVRQRAEAVTLVSSDDPALLSAALRRWAAHEPGATAWRGLAAFVFAVCAGRSGWGRRVAAGGPATQAASRARRPHPTSAPSVRRTGQPCLGCGGTEAFGDAARGTLRGGGRGREPAGRLRRPGRLGPGRGEPADPHRGGRGLAAWDGSVVLALLPAAFVRERGRVVGVAASGCAAWAPGGSFELV